MGHLKPTWSDGLFTLLFVARHGLIVLALAVMACMLWTVAYCLLLIIAIAGDYPTGSPVVYPLGLILFALGVMIIGWGIYAPACAAGRLFCRLTRLPKLAAIPVVLISAVAIVMLMRMALEAISSHATASIFHEMEAGDFLLLAVTLGIYWWLTEGPGAIWELASRIWRQVSARNGRQSQQGAKTPQITVREEQPS